MRYFFFSFFLFLFFGYSMRTVISDAFDCLIPADIPTYVQ